MAHVQLRELYSQSNMKHVRRVEDISMDDIAIGSIAVEYSLLAITL